MGHLGCSNFTVVVFLIIKHLYYKTTELTFTVPDFLCAGLNPTDISRQLIIARSSVYKVKKMLECTGTLKRKTGNGQNRSARTIVVFRREN